MLPVFVVPFPQNPRSLPILLLQPTRPCICRNPELLASSLLFHTSLSRWPSCFFTSVICCSTSSRFSSIVRRFSPWDFSRRRLRRPLATVCRRCSSSFSFSKRLTSALSKTLGKEGEMGGRMRWWWDAAGWVWMGASWQQRWWALIGMGGSASSEDL